MQMIRCTKCMAEMREDDRYCPSCGYDRQSGGQPSNALPRNTILHGRYLVGNVIGQGGFGITYVGYDLTLEMKVAVKEYFRSGSAMRTGSFSSNIQWDFGENDEKQLANGIERFLKEARRMARLDSVPSVVRVRDTFKENQTAYIVMDFVEGVTLKNYLLSHGVLRWDECLRLLGPVLDSLAVIHDNGFIHRDISPDNIMLQPDGTARVLDMGAAMDVQASGGHASMVVVKRNFSAPEQYLESEALGSWTDVYSMAATIYYCLTGRVVPEAMEREFKKTPLQFSPELAIPQNVKEAVTAGLELRAEGRIRDMRELKRRLAGTAAQDGPGQPGQNTQAVQNTQPTSTPPVSPIGSSIQPLQDTGLPEQGAMKKKIVPKGRAKRMLAAAAVLTACVIGVGILGSGSGKSGTRNTSVQASRTSEAGTRAASMKAETAQTAAQADAGDSGDYVSIELSELTYETAEDGGLILTSYSGDKTGGSSMLSFPDEIDGIPVTELGEYLMEKNTLIEQVRLPEGLVRIGIGAFSECSSLTDITLPKEMKSIGAFAFYKCASLTSLSLPEGLKYIETGAMAETGIRELTIPASLVGFGGISMLETVKVNEGNACYSVEDGALFDAFGSGSKSLVLVSISKKGHYTVPEGVWMIHMHAFNGSQLTSVTVPASVDKITNFAFAGAGELRKVVLSEGTVEIGSKAFKDCQALEDITIPRSVTSIQADAFSGCSSLRSVTVSRGCKVDEKAFEAGVEIQYYD